VCPPGETLYFKPAAADLDDEDRCSPFLYVDVELIVTTKHPTTSSPTTAPTPMHPGYNTKLIHLGKVQAVDPGLARSAPLLDIPYAAVAKINDTGDGTVDGLSVFPVKARPPDLIVWEPAERGIYYVGRDLRDIECAQIHDWVLYHRLDEEENVEIVHPRLDPAVDGYGCLRAREEGPDVGRRRCWVLCQRLGDEENVKIVHPHLDLTQRWMAMREQGRKL
jgi:hypothetical protein